MYRYFAEIIDGALGEGNTLERYLNSQVAEGREIFTVLPNGLNRWTVISRQLEA